jgi:nicotinamidase-related amidase
MRGGAPEGTNTLLIIDPQSDFCFIKGSLFVPNANVDINRLSKFLLNTKMKFDSIHISLDSHNLTHIAHKGFWDLTEEQITQIDNFHKSLNYPMFAVVDDKIMLKFLDIKGKAVAGYTDFEIKPRGFITIDLKEVSIDKDLLTALAKSYITKLTEKFNAKEAPPPVMWTTHCIIGTGGWKILSELDNAIKLYIRKFGCKVNYHEKGTNDLVEMYSIFESEIKYDELERSSEIQDYLNPKIPDPIDTNTKPNSKRNYVTTFNTKLYDFLKENNNIYVCGEAKTHCVKTSATDLAKYLTNDFSDASKMIMLTNVMSDIPAPDFIKGSKRAFGILQSQRVRFATIEENDIKMNDNYNPESD